MPEHIVFCRRVVLLVVFCLPNVAAAVISGHRRHLRIQQEVTGAGRHEVNASHGGSLLDLAESCKCSFTGMCSCVQALEFMKCIQSACDSSVCDCGNHHYFYACKSMKVECPSAGLQCTPTESTCEPIPPFVTGSVMKSVDKLEALRSQKCDLEEAKDGGWINAKAKQEKLEPQIQEVVEDLRGKGVQPPSPLGCSEKDGQVFQEFREGLERQKEEEDAEAKADAAEEAEKEEAAEKAAGLSEDQSASVEKTVEKTNEGKAAETGDSQQVPWTWTEKSESKSDKSDLDELKEVAAKSEAAAQSLEEQLQSRKAPFVPKRDIPGSIGPLWDDFSKEMEDVTKGKMWWLKLPSLSVLLFAWLHIVLAIICAYVYAKYREKWTPKQSLLSGATASGFGVGLFSCFTDMRICIISCCCPCLRWADTTDRADLGLTYWKAFAAFFFFMFMGSYTYGIAFLFLAALGAGFRGRLRRRSGVSGRPIEDCAIWLCCQTCAIVQEARITARMELEEWYAEQEGKPDYYRG